MRSLILARTKTASTEDQAFDRGFGVGYTKAGGCRADRTFQSFPLKRLLAHGATGKRSNGSIAKGVLAGIAR